MTGYAFHPAGQLHSAAKPSPAPDTDSDSAASAWMRPGRQRPDRGAGLRQDVEQLLVVRSQSVYYAHQVLAGLALHREPRRPAPRRLRASPRTGPRAARTAGCRAGAGLVERCSDQQDPPVCDGQGRPLAFATTGGNTNDCTQFAAVLEAIRVPASVRDGYGSGSSRHRRQGLKIEDDPHLAPSAGHRPRHSRAG